MFLLLQALQNTFSYVLALLLGLLALLIMFSWVDMDGVGQKVLWSEFFVSFIL